ncbi:hypothetical protein I6G82_06055 [Lysinibacillus macroides]|uniref:hypothetical protein n=1 Tax=Lysinibacillus macroides TaxID=33935 RepID=UPI0006B5CE0C|nr:hypothetical protein [Lysinibacillus macroides]QPR69175.1 hypothetical protein I6G82_06055 [Lysinibacillus macroides]
MLNTPMKRVITLITVVIISFTLVWIMKITQTAAIVEVHVDANEIIFETPEKLEAAADLIIIASPTKEFMDREHQVTFFDDGTIQDYYTLTEVLVEKIIKSPDDFSLADNQLMSIIEPVGIVERQAEKKKLITNHYKELQEDSAYILFLKQNMFGQYAIINNNLGKFNIDQTDSSDIGEEKLTEAKQFKEDVLKKYMLP